MSANDEQSKVATYLFLGFAALAAFMLLFGWSYIWFWHDSTPRGILVSTADWPDAVQQLHEKLVAIDPAIDVDGYLTHGQPGPFSVSEAAFRVCHSSPEIVDALKNELKLVSIKSNHRLAGWGQVVIDKASNEWWASPRFNDTQIFASQPLLDGEEGDLYVVAYESATNTIYISYHFNF